MAGYSVSGVSSSSKSAAPIATSSTGSNAAGLNLTASDFIKMMITQLQNQDPLSPTSNQDLLGQMSQIGQLQTSTTLQTSLQSMTLQTAIGSAGNLIGKTVQGLDDYGNPAGGVVSSVKVQQNNVYLELDNGKSLAMANVTQIAPTTVPTAAATPTKGNG